MVDKKHDEHGAKELETIGYSLFGPPALIRARKQSDEKGEEARKAAEHDPNMIGGFIGLKAGVPVGLIAEADAVAETLKMEAEGARLRAEQLRDGCEIFPRSLPWRPFPIEVLPEAASVYVRAQAAAIGCDMATVAPLVIGVLATAVGNSHRIALKSNWTEHPTLWLAVVARSGEHKSPALYAALRPVYDREKKAAAEHGVAREQYEKDLVDYNALDKTVKGMTEKPVPPVATRYRTGDATVESLAFLHNENPRGFAVVRDELAGLFGAFDKYSGGSSDMQSWIEIADGRPVVIDRKTGERKTLRIESPCVSIIGGTQPGILRDKLKPSFFDSGFAARFLFVAPPPNVPRFTDADVEIGVRQRYDDLVGDLYDRPHGGEPIPLSEEARRLFKGFYDASHLANANVSSERLRSAFVKHVGFCARFALILHLADTPGQQPKPITADAMQRAIKLALWFRHETARIYHKFGFTNSHGSNRDEELVRQLPESFGWQDVSDAWGVKKAGAYKVIKRLEEASVVEDAGHGSYCKCTVDFGDFEGVEVELTAVSLQSLPSTLAANGDGATSSASFEDDFEPWANEDPLGVGR